MKKKLIYISYEEGNGLAGVVRKIKSQCRAFEEAGIEVKRVLMPPKKVKGWKIIYRLPFSNINPYWHWDSAFEKCDYIYLRYPRCINYQLLKLLRQIKQSNKKVKIIVELHSGIAFNYLKRDLRTLDAAIKDFCCRCFLRKYVDVIAELMEDIDVKRIYGTNVIHINNGFDFSTMRVRNHESNSSSINLVAASSMNKAHGYDRIINGLHEYYKNGGNRIIKFRIIGDGEELSSYRKMISKYGLNKYVKLYGYLPFNDIITLYDKSDIGVSALAMHRQGFKGSSLNSVMKNKEYIAAGLPVFGCKEMDLNRIPALKKYILEVPDNESPIDIERIIEFYDSLYDSKNELEIEEMIRRIREAGEESLSYAKTMRGVIDYINE